MPLFSDLSSLGHYYSGSTSLNYLSGPYAGHSSIVAANYRTPTSTYSKPSSRAFANRGYTPLLATISENQITRAGLSRMNSPKMMYHASPKYKIQKPISINTADIDVSSNRYRRNLERTPLPISKPSQSAPKSPERSSSFKDNKENKESSPKKDEDSDGMFMPRIDKNFRSTIKRERTVVRFHTNRNLDKSATDETPKTEEEKRRETVRVFDEEVKLHKQKWRENFDPDELSPAKKRPQPQKPLSERLVEKFIIKEKLDEDVLNYEERRKQREENLLNYDGKCNIQRNSSRRKSVKKVPSFHDICRTISSESIDEDLNPGQPITRRNTRKKSSYDVLKAIRRDSAEINQEEILLLDALIKEAHLDKEYEITKQDEPKTEEPDKVEESDTKRKKKFTKKKSNELLVDDTKEETKCSPQRRKIVKKKTSGSLDKAIEVITPKEIKIDNSVQCEEAVASPTRKTMPKITGTVEVEMKPILKLVIDDIQVEETIMTSSSSPTSKKFKYNVTIEEIKSPNILDIPEIDLLSKLNNKTKSKIEDNKTEITKLKDVNQKKLENKIQLTTEPSGISKVEEDNIKYKKEMIIVNDKLDKELQNLTSLNKAELEKQKMLDIILGKTKTSDQKIEDEKAEILGKKEETKQAEYDQKAEAEKSKMLDKLLGKKEVAITKNAEVGKPKILDKLTNKQEEPKLIDSLLRADEEKEKIINKLLGKNELTDSVRKAEEEKAKIIDKLLGKKEDSIINVEKAKMDKKEEQKQIDSAKKAEEEKAKMLDKLIGKKEEPKLTVSVKKTEEDKPKILNKSPSKKEESNLTDAALKAKEDKAKSDKKAEEEKNKMLDRLLGKKEDPKITGLAKKAEEIKALSDKKAEEEKAKMLDILLGKKEEPKITDIAKKAEEVKALSDKKAEEEKAKMLDRLLGKKEEPKITDIAKKAEEVKALSDKKAEEEKAKMLDRLLGKKEELKITDLTKKSEEVKALSDKKAEEEKAKMLDRLLGKTAQTKITVAKIAEEEKAKLDKKAEEEKEKMISKLMSKKEEPKLVDSVRKAEEEKIKSDKKAEDEKAKMLDKLLGKTQEDKKASLEIDSDKKAEEEKNKMLDKLLGKKPADLLQDTDKNKIKEELNKNVQKDQPKSLAKKLDITSKQLNEAKKSNLLSKVAPITNNVEKIDRRKTVQKQENLDELDIDNFWDKMGKRETIYYKDRRKYLNDRREQELKKICWDADWVEEEGEEESESPKIEPKGVQSERNISTELQEFPKPKTDTLKQEISKIEDPQITKLGAVSKIEEKVKPKEISKKLDNTQKPKLLSPKSTIKDASKLDLKSNIESKKEAQKEITLEAKATKIAPVVVLEEKIKPEVPKPIIQNASKQLDTKVEIEEKSSGKQEDSKIVTKEPIKPKLDSKPTEVSLDLNETLKTSKDIQKLGTKVKEEILDVKEPSILNQKLKLGVKSKESLETKEQETTKVSKEEIKDACVPKKKLSNKQKSDENNKNIRPKVKRKSKEEPLKKQLVHYTQVQLEEMKGEIVEVKFEPITPHLSFIIKDKFDPVLKPNKDIIIPTAEEFANQEENKDDENRLGDKKTIAPMQSNYLAPDPKPKPKPKWFDTCPVVIMATPRDLRNRGHRMQKPAPKVTYVSDSSSAESDSSDEETSSSDTSGGSDVFETNVVFDYNKNAGNKWKSTSSNDSGFDSSAPGSPANNRNRIDGSTNASTSSSDSPSVLAPANNPAFILEPMEASTAYTAYQRSGRVTPPATSIPRFRKYAVEDFCFLKVLGKGSFGKVMLAELRNTEYYYAVKCLKKDIVLEDDDVECTLIERKVLALGTKHPYLCHLFCTFQTESHLFFVMEYLNGGDLMFHIQMSGRFPEPRARFYGAEIVSGLKFLHSKGIVYRDLKLDNILLDFDGHVRIADFGMCKLQIFLDRTADTFCGTPDYMAPEIIKGQHYNQGVDWWSFGVLLYEMLIGQSPFSGCDEDELFWSICNERPVIPAFLSREASQILTLLLEKDSAKRLGNKYCPAGDISDQSFFSQIDWGSLERRQLEAPFKPKVQHPLDTQYFDKAFTTEKAKLTPIEKDILHSMDQTQFHGFSYTNPNATDK